MLGLLFEQLIAAVDQGDSDKLMERMPDGTYYTPVDVVWEMAKEATAARLLQEPLPTDGRPPTCGACSTTIPAICRAKGARRWPIGWRR